MRLMRLFRISSIAALATLTAMIAAPHEASAQVAVNLSPTGTNPVLGRVVRGSTASTFSISTTGVVTSSGDAIRMTSAGAGGTTATISCGLLNLACVGRTLRVTIYASGASGSATLTKFRVGSLSGNTYVGGAAPAEASTLTFDLNGLGLLGWCTFAIGMDVLVPVSGVTGPGTYTYTVTVNAL